MALPGATWAPTLYRKLGGILCVYKPADVAMDEVLKRIQFNLARDLNVHPCYKVESIMQKMDPTADISRPMSFNSSLPVPVDDMVEHRLVLGPRYIPEHIDALCIDSLGSSSSGVSLLTVGRDCSDMSDQIAQSRYMRVYHVKGRFGWATNDYTPTGKIIERTSYRHIKVHKFDKVLQKIRFNYLRNMYRYAGVDVDSQAAADLAARGFARPENDQTPPMIYDIKCIEYQPPDFTLEIHSINEMCDLFMEMVHHIGLQLRSTAVCTGIRRLRYGPFHLTHALLRQHWTLSRVVDNLSQNRSVYTPETMAGESNIDVLNREPGDRRPRQADSDVARGSVTGNGCRGPACPLT